MDLDTGSYILNKATGHRTPMYVKNGTFKYRIWVKSKPTYQSKTSDQDMSFGAIQKGEDTPVGFRRQAVFWP